MYTYQCSVLYLIFLILFEGRWCEVREIYKLKEVIINNKAVCALAVATTTCNNAKKAKRMIVNQVKISGRNLNHRVGVLVP